MQHHTKVWLLCAAIGGPGCAGGVTDESERSPAPRTTSAPDDDPFGGAPLGSRNGGSAGQSGKGGTAASAAGSAGRDPGGGGAGANGGGGVSGAADVGGGGMAASPENNAGSRGIATTPEPAADCPSLTRVLLESGACVDRVTEFAVATSPTSIVTGADGQVWFDDDGGNQLVQLDSEGRVLKRVDCDEGSSPRALAGGRDDVLVWYTDAGAKTLNRLTQTGLTTFELEVTAAAVALGEGDELWLTEAEQALYRVHPYVSIDPYPVAPTRALVLGSDHNVWFPNGSVMGRLSPDRSAKYFSLGTSFADELCAGPDGALWFTDSAQHRIGRMELGGAVRTFDLPPGSAPTRIVAGPDDAVWFIAEGGDKIGRISVDGELTQYPIPTSGGLPYALTVGGDRNIWFTEKFSGKVGRLLPDRHE